MGQGKNAKKKGVSKERVVAKKKYLSRTAAAAYIGVNKDTLINWEAKGIITPLRMGARRDRRYTEAMLLEAFDTAGKDIDAINTLDTKEKLGAFLWKAADILRDRVPPAKYQDYIYPLLFFKRISDVWAEEYEAALVEYVNDVDLAKEDFNYRFVIRDGDHWR